MSIRDWLRRGFFALLALAIIPILYIGLQDIGSEYSNGEQKAAERAAQQERVSTGNIANDCLPLPEGIERSICVSEQLYAQYEAERSQYDLNAQRTVARVSIWMYVAALAQATIGLFGLLFISESLSQSAKAVKLTQQAFIAENRPWLKIAVTLSGRFEVEEGRAGALLVIEVANVGNSPALDVWVRSEVIDVYDQDMSEVVADWVTDETEVFASKKGLAGEAIFPGESPDRFHPTYMTTATLHAARQNARLIDPRLAVMVSYRSPVDPKTPRHTFRLYNYIFRNGTTERNTIDTSVGQYHEVNSQVRLAAEASHGYAN